MSMLPRNTHRVLFKPSVLEDEWSGCPGCGLMAGSCEQYPNCPGGQPPPLLQDECRDLSIKLSQDPNARQWVRDSIDAWPEYVDTRKDYRKEFLEKHLGKPFSVKPKVLLTWGREGGVGIECTVDCEVYNLFTDDLGFTTPVQLPEGRLHVERYQREAADWHELDGHLMDKALERAGK